MGGLVARISNGLGGKGNSNILGVIHGMMPATGAPLLYRQIVAGSEQESNPLLLHDLRTAKAKLLGRTRAETTPVIANSPGCLELLPSHLYPPGWLIVTRQFSPHKRNTEIILPIANNPYIDIYKEKEEIWRMINPALLDPAKIHQRDRNSNQGSSNAWNEYSDLIDEVQELHCLLLGNTNYHPNSYAFFSSGKLTYKSVNMIITARKEKLKFLSLNNYSQYSNNNDHSKFNISIKHNIFHQYNSNNPYLVMQNANSKNFDLYDLEQPKEKIQILAPKDQGDDTVPEESGLAPGNHISGIFRLNSVSHQNAFESHAAQTFTLLALCKLVGEKA